MVRLIIVRIVIITIVIMIIMVVIYFKYLFLSILAGLAMGSQRLRQSNDGEVASLANAVDAPHDAPAYIDM